MHDYAIKADQLVKTFDAVVAVDGITLRVRRGECFGILGPNGAGKTSTIRMLYGGSPPSSGRLEILGHDIQSELRAVKAQLGVCPQENNLDPDLTVLQNLEVYAGYFAIPKDVARQRAANMLEFVALAHRRHNNVATLSGGLMRRLVLARALINTPKLLILDEPTTGLDPQSRHQLWSRLEELKIKGLTILLTTHYMEEAARLCDRLVILDHGRILVEGAPASLVQSHVGHEVLEIAEPPESLRTLVQTRGLPHEDLGHRLLIYGADSDALYHQVVATHCRSGCTLRPATLEDVFLRLTGRELRE